MEVTRNEQLWKIAKKRAKFKKYLLTFVIINAFLWTIWYMTDYVSGRTEAMVPWPLWATVGWGIGLAFSYFRAYHEVGAEDLAEKEYEKLLNEKK
jgi:Na+-driven multidrug efflux pump